MPEREETAPAATHIIGLAVWDVTSPVVAGRRATLKVGLACAAGCNFAGTQIYVYNETGTRVGGATLGPTAWPATTALYWAELDVAAPESEGDHAWSLHATVPDSLHVPTTSMLRFVAVGPPEHRVTLVVIDKGSSAPLAGVELRVGRFRSATNESGVAHVEVPGGTYDVCAWKIGYDVLSTTAPEPSNICVSQGDHRRAGATSA